MTHSDSDECRWSFSREHCASLASVCLYVKAVNSGSFQKCWKFRLLTSPSDLTEISLCALPAPWHCRVPVVFLSFLGHGLVCAFPQQRTCFPVYRRTELYVRTEHCPYFHFVGKWEQVMISSPALSSFSSVILVFDRGSPLDFLINLVFF